MQNRIDEVLKEQGKTYKDLVALTGLSNYVIGDIAHGRDEATLGDWIATGIDGEHWAIADDIFRRTYERCD